MSIKDKFYEQSIIQITIMKVDGKKFTKSIFEQLSDYRIFDKDYNIVIDKIFGYIKNPVKINNIYVMFWLIGEMDGKIIRARIDHIIRLSELDLDKNVKNDNRPFSYYLNSPKFYIKNSYLDESDDFYEPLVADEIKYGELIKEELYESFKNNLMKVKEFVKEIREHQIYI